MRSLITLLLCLPSLAMAGTFQPPIPETQTATAEFSYAIASLAFVAMLIGAQLLVRRR